MSSERHLELDGLAPAADTVTVTNMLMPVDEKRTARALSRRGAVKTPKSEGSALSVVVGSECSRGQTCGFCEFQECVRGIAWLLWV